VSHTVEIPAEHGRWKAEKDGLSKWGGAFIRRGNKGKKKQKERDSQLGDQIAALQIYWRGVALMSSALTGQNTKNDTKIRVQGTPTHNST